MALFGADFLSRLEYLSLVSRRAFRGQLIANRRSRQLGGGIEFADHQPYAAGDDFRYLDWHVFARHDELLLKRFAEEQDLHVHLLVDCSRSMAFGHPAKFDHARRIAAAMAYIALADLDRVAITAFADDVVADLPMTRGKARIAAMMRFLEALDVQGADTDLARAAQAVVHRGTRRGPVIVISDLYDPSGYERGIDLLRYHRFEPHLIRVFDPAEARPQLLGDMELVDTETDRVRKVTITEAHTAQYRILYGDFVDAARAYCNRHALGYTEADAAQPFDELILAMMRAGVAR
jgi:uncharacterized protein (DUF58 family)